KLNEGSRFVSRPPSQKGTSVLPVVLALRQRPQARALLPAELWKYLDEPMFVSGWYPEKDYWVLLEALVQSIDAASVGGDVWLYFARFSVQRDIGGQDVATPGSGTAKGIYRSFATGGAIDLDNFFRRVTRLWSQYHDTGQLEIVGGRSETNSIVMRLTK